jgi:spore coat polysaccharide biosynthesis protein SpsF
MKASVIIQARMASSRLPGKVMLKISGKPLIGYQIERLKVCNNVENIIVATSTEESNIPLCEYLHSIGIKTYIGDEDDVLKRFYYAAKENNVRNIVRLTADCPLIDPKIVDKYIAEFFSKDLDYIYPDLTFAEGLDTEVFTFDALERAFNYAKRTPEREHVTQYFHNNKDMFKISRLVNTTDDSKYRITVDEENDFIVVKKIFEALYKDSNSVFGIEEIKEFLNQNPNIYFLNSLIMRNEGLQISLDAEKEKTDFS